MGARVGNKSNNLKTLSDITKKNGGIKIKVFAEMGKENPNVKTVEDAVKTLQGDIQMSPYATNKAGDTVLHMAVRGRHLDIIAFYFKTYSAWNIDIDIRNAKGETPRSLAEGDKEILALLINPNKLTVSEIAKPSVRKKRRVKKIKQQSPLSGNQRSEKSIRDVECNQLEVSRVALESSKKRQVHRLERS